jgi:hypothetical protein
MVSRRKPASGAFVLQKRNYDSFILFVVFSAGNCTSCLLKGSRNLLDNVHPALFYLSSFSDESLVSLLTAASDCGLQHLRSVCEQDLLRTLQVITMHAQSC